MRMLSLNSQRNVCFFQKMPCNKKSSKVFPRFYLGIIICTLLGYSVVNLATGKAERTTTSPFGQPVSGEFNKFKSAQPDVLQVEEGVPYKLTCNQSDDGYPERKVIWKLQKLPISEGHAIIDIDSPRITAAPDGNLYFSNVTLQDTEYVYICVASIGSLNGKMFPKYLNATTRKTEPSNSHHTYKPVMQYASKRNTTALLGSSVGLWCVVGGTPLPAIKWTKTRKQLGKDLRLEYKNYGKTVLLNNVTFNDSGHYRCTVENGIEHPKSRSIQLSVFSVPYFVVQPEDTFLGKGVEMTEISCAAEGEPFPEIQWTYDGNVLEANPKTEILPNKLVIRNVTKADEGHYACNASNEFGHVFKSISLVVSATPAKVVVKPNNLVTFVGNKQEAIFCHIEGYPFPTYYWRKDGQVVNHKKAKVMIRKLLYINFRVVTMEDAGEYSCHVENRLGNDSASAILFVQPGIKLVDKPQDQQAAVGTTIYLNCTSNVKHPAFKPTIIWRKNEQGIDFNSSFPHYVQLNNSLKISNVTRGDSGVYECVAKATATRYTAEVSASAILSVEDVPDAPRIKLLGCDTNMAYFDCEEMDRHQLPVLFYQVEYNTSFRPGEWKTVSKNTDLTELRFSIPVSPWTNYTFQITAVNKMGPSHASKISRMCSTEPDVPNKNPDNVHGQGNTTSNMIISWKPMPKIDHNGPNFMYVVEWKEQNGNLSEWNSVNVTDWRADHYVVDNIPSFKKYFVRVLAKNEIGEAEASPNIIIGSSGVGEPPEGLNWILPFSSALTVVIVLLAIALIFLRKYYQKALLSQKEVNNFLLGSKSPQEKNSSYALPYDKERYEVDKKAFKFDEDGMLGSGEFGMVCKGSLERGGATTAVAIKMANPDKTHRTIINGLLSEIKVLAYVGKHENITELLGANTAELKLGKVYILLEMCPMGSLEKHLRKMRPVKDDQLTEENEDNNRYSATNEMVPLGKEPVDPLLSTNLFRWSQEICNGMAYLAAKHVVHADLATRNVLLGANKEAKICDFGLSRRMYNYASYVKSQQEPLPWKWMAPESLRVQEFNEKTDVWAYGITLWEMYSLGDSPYQGMSWDINFGQMLQRGFRMGEPEFNERNMYSVMKRCWTFTPDLRPTFTDLSKYFK